MATTVSDLGRVNRAAQFTHVEAIGHGSSAGQLKCNGNITTTAGNIVATAGNITATAGNIVATAGNFVATVGAITLGKTTNQIIMGTTNTVTISSTAPAASRTLTIPDYLASGSILVGAVSGAVTQATSITTAVTLNAPSGIITTVSATTAAVSESQFTLNNSLIAATSVVLVSVQNYAGTYATNGIPTVKVQTVGAGSAIICVDNVHASNALSGVLKIGFLVC